MNELLAGFMWVLGGILGLAVGISGILFLLAALAKAENKRKPR